MFTEMDPEEASSKDILKLWIAVKMVTSWLLFLGNLYSSSPMKFSRKFLTVNIWNLMSRNSLNFLLLPSCNFSCLIWKMLADFDLISCKQDLIISNWLPLKDILKLLKTLNVTDKLMKNKLSKVRANSLSRKNNFRNI